MDTLDQIKAPIKIYLKDFTKEFNQSMKSRVPLLNTITRYMVKRKGKQIRPIFVFLSAGICGEISAKTSRAASLIELLHTATLIHDDVVDESYKRRGFFSSNALRGNKIAVLVGDFLLSRGLLLSVKNNDHDLLKIVSDAVQEMSEGELLQIEKARKLDIEEDIYFEIIRKKTATLIASCCATGAASVGASANQVEAFWEFGENVGIAFQIKDDIFDYQQSTNKEKPAGIDIKEKKMTLPLIFLLKNSSYVEQRKIIYQVKNKSRDPKIVAEIIEKVKQSGGIEYAKKHMNHYHNLALDFLKQFPESEFKTSLQTLVEYTTSRNR
ncbi:MAG: polyprenyl synthetase [Bacteroidetes bacterium HGW-Bacteroidetes-17]|nr:MAG: polyprenyl synthetase [Bacteroidetes bacterium HGW-Bacteroidetes-17]